jgi:hypothetical protein
MLNSPLSKVSVLTWNQKLNSYLQASILTQAQLNQISLASKKLQAKNKESLGMKRL